MIQRWTIILTATLALAACDRGSPPASADPEAKPAEPISIVRADADIARAEPALEALDVTIPFAGGGGELSDAAIARLEAALASPQMAAGGVISLGGHSDSGGDDAANLRASQQRAEAARDWLVLNGVAEERITIIAFGEQNPVRPNALPDGTPDETARAANRRVEMTISVPEQPAPPAPSDTPGSLVEQVATED